MPVTQVNVHEAKTHLSRLLERVEKGEEVVIARSGRPVARLVAVEVARQPRVPGLLKGKIWIADDFDDCVYHPEEMLAFGMLGDDEDGSKGSGGTGS